jgi:PBP1b-binding outer membrane lipoprotein LpoB
MKNKIQLIVIIIFLLLSCSSQERPQNMRVKNESKKIESVVVENFDTFFLKFSSDSIFQVSRIIFPLKAEINDVDDGYSVSEMSQKEWGFINFSQLGSEYLIKVIKSDTSNVVNLQINDTGVYVDYIFRFIEGKWIMVKVADSST